VSGALRPLLLRPIEDKIRRVGSLRRTDVKPTERKTTPMRAKTLIPGLLTAALFLTAGCDDKKAEAKADDKKADAKKDEKKADAKTDEAKTDEKKEGDEKGEGW